MSMIQILLIIALVIAILLDVIRIRQYIGMRKLLDEDAKFLVKKMKKTDIILLAIFAIITIAIMEIVVHLIGVRAYHSAIISGAIVGTLLSMNNINRKK